MYIAVCFIIGILDDFGMWICGMYATAVCVCVCARMSADTLVLIVLGWV